MSKFLKFIVNLFLICAILAAAAILVPPIVGIQTTIIDNASMDTNLPLGSITYSTDITVDELKTGDEVLKDSSSSTYAYIIKGKASDANKYRVVSATDKNGAEETVSFEGSVPRVRVIVPYLGYIIIAMHSTEGMIIIGLVVALVIILFILSELWKKEPEDEEEDEAGVKTPESDADGVLQEKQSRKAEKKEEKARAKAAKKEKKHRKDNGQDDVLPRPDVTVDVNPEIINTPETSFDDDTKEPEGGTSDDEFNEFMLKMGDEDQPEAAKEAEPEIHPEAKTEGPKPKSETETDKSEPDEPAKTEPGKTEAGEAEAPKPEPDEPKPKEPVSENKEKTEAAPTAESARSEDEPGAVEKKSLPDGFDLSEAIETATKEAEAKAEEARSKTTPIKLPKEAYSLDDLKEDEPEPVDDSKREFTPVEHATLDELLDKAKKDGEEPEVRKDDATGITFVDYSDEL